MKKIVAFVLLFAVCSIYADEKAACKAVSEFAAAMKQKNYAKAYQYIYNKRGRLSRDEFIRDAKRGEKQNAHFTLTTLKPISAEVDGNEATMKCRIETVVEIKTKKVKGKWVIADIDL